MAACTSPGPPRPRFDCRRRRHGNTGAAGFDCRRRRHAGWPQGKREPRAIVRGAWWGRGEEPRALGRLAQGDRLKEGDTGEGGEEADKGIQDVWQYSDSDSLQFDSVGIIFISFPSPSALRKLGTDAPGGSGRRLVDRRPQAQPQPPPLITAGPAARGRKHGRKHVVGGA